MPFELTNFAVFTIVLIAGAGYVLLLRSKRLTESIVPLLYYGVLLIYVNGSEDRLPAWVVCVGLISALLLRFEFLNTISMRIVGAIEVAALVGIVYECSMMLIQR